MNRYYVYTHSDLEGNVFYVGKGTKRRAWDKNRGKFWKQKVKVSGGYEVDIPFDNLTEEEALDLEAVLIETYGIDNLVNRKKETPKQNHSKDYYSLLQKAKDIKTLFQILDDFDYYWKDKFIRKQLKDMIYIQELHDEVKKLL